jgi:hypothetical protein
MNLWKRLFGGSSNTGTDILVDPVSVIQIRFAFICDGPFPTAEWKDLYESRGQMGRQFLPHLWNAVVKQAPNATVKLSSHSSYESALREAMDLYPNRAVVVVPLTVAMKFPSTGILKEYKIYVFIHYGQQSSLASNTVLLVHPNNRIVAQ